MINRIFICVIVLSSIIISSCKKTDSTGIAGKPVVIAYLIPGQAVTVKVYQQKDFDDTTSYGALIAGLQPTISDGGEKISLAETATGTYTYSDTTYLKTGKTYSLQFSYNGLQVNASTQMPAKPTGFTASKSTVVLITPTTGGGISTSDSIAVSFRWNNPDSLYHILYFKSDQVSPASTGNRFGPVNFSYNVKQASGYDAYHRSLSYLGGYSAILYTVNKEYSDVLVSNANTSSQQLVNPPGNIINGYGIFTAMQADTLRLVFTQ
jgi:hypothetical protein